MKKEYWKSLEELKQIREGENPASLPEFSGELSHQEPDSGTGFTANRRDFLKALGFSFGYAALAAGCEQPVRKAIPYLNQPEEVTPAVANHYASTYYDGHDYCPLLVKSRDGRPIKIEGNEMSDITSGGTSARVQASVLGLYDSARLKHPSIGGEKSEWETVDSEIITRLKELRDQDKPFIILSPSVISPSTREVFSGFRDEYPNTRIIFYDSVSFSALREANKRTFDIEGIPVYRFDKAKVIAGFNADFLGSWLSPVEFAHQYGLTRELTDKKRTMSRHYQFESWLSLTGSNADYRTPIRPSEEEKVLRDLYNILARNSAMREIEKGNAGKDLTKLASDLRRNRGASLVVSGTNSLNIQLLVNAINHILGNIGHTVDFSRLYHHRQCNDGSVERLVRDMNHGEIGGLLLYHVNPVYDYLNGEGFRTGLNKLDLTIAITDTIDESMQHTRYVCPDHHYLEAWGDAEYQTGRYSLAQPLIRNLFNTRQGEDSLLLWSGKGKEFHTVMKEHWKKHIFSRQQAYSDFEKFWFRTVQKGIFRLQTEEALPSFNREAFESGIDDRYASGKKAVQDEVELILYEKIGMGTGKQANNPWLQELPDPISKAVWDNYIALSPRWARENGLEQEDVVRISDDLELPVLLQPGQPYGTASIALGYGRTNAGKVGNGIGVNVYGLVEYRNRHRLYSGKIVRPERARRKYRLATTQTHHSMEGRPLIRETIMDKWKQKPDAGNEMHKINQKNAVTLYEIPVYQGPHWGLGVDLNKCTGCSACVTACQVENNVAVIGKAEVARRRIMHWMRIDRYFSVIGGDKEGPEDFFDIEPENPDVMFQPVLCQHCDNAPCENVCPVAATPHSKEGLNQMAYNRCIGTRYCMNNCPYRVRRFNWFKYVDNDKFDYNFNDEMSKMVLNPDVTVRSRGVVEKCSFCVQRIQEKKLEAKKQGRLLRDGEIQPACVQACPSKALVFGDRNDPDSTISGYFSNPRMYHLLEELHTLSSVGYLTKVRNREKGAHEGDDRHHG